MIFWIQQTGSSKERRILHYSATMWFVVENIVFKTDDLIQDRQQTNITCCASYTYPVHCTIFVSFSPTVLSLSFSIIDVIVQKR